MKLTLVSNGTTGGGNGAPTTATQGKPLRRAAEGQTAGEGMPEDIDEVTILVEGVGAAAANSIAYVKLWGYFPEAVGASSGAKWFPLGTAALDADRGKINNGAAIGEIAAANDRIYHAERIRGIADCSRIYAEYGGLTNTTRVDITLVSAGRGRT